MEDDKKNHPPRDYLLDPTLSALSGSDVILDGTKADRSGFTGRRLTNVSFVPHGGSIFVIGMEEGHGIRQFDLKRIERMQTELFNMDRQAVMASLDKATKKFSSSSPEALPSLEGGSV